MKKTVTILVLVMIATGAFAQAPDSMSFQAVIRNATNNLITNQLVGMRVSILQGSPTGAVVYQETQTPTTNINGLASLAVGRGTVVSGNFSTIDWSAGPYYIRTETDPAGGASYSIFSTTSLLSVPYALFSKTSASGWNLKGNAGTDTATYFIGTTDNNGLKLKVNNLHAGLIATDGQTFMGARAGEVNQGSNNTAYGGMALQSNTTGGANTATGFQALRFDTTGSFNTANGASALYSNTTGYYNTANGASALYSNTTGSNNTASGGQALLNNTEGSENTANGTSALYYNTTGSNNTANGANALYYNTTGSNNTANGANALYSNTTGTNNTASGFQALAYNTTGYNNTAVGPQALLSNIAGYNNTAIGFQALRFDTIGNNNTATGFQALYSNFGGGPYYEKGIRNTATGSQALYSNTTGTNNTASGFQALYSNTLGASSNTATGSNSLVANTTGNENTAIGYNSLAANISGSNNTAIGANANVSVDGLRNATAIGNGALATLSNSVRIGNGAVTSITGNAAYVSTSDGRFKTNIKEDKIPGLDFILGLKPIRYNLDTKKLDEYAMQLMPDSIKAARMLKPEMYAVADSVVHTGFVAQDVERLIKNGGYIFDGVKKPANITDPYGIAYSQFVVPLVNAVKEEHTTIQEQQAAILKLQAKNAFLEKKIEEMAKQISLLLERK